MSDGATITSESLKEMNGRWPLEPTEVMFFGLTSSLATFQTFMNHILRDKIVAGHVIVYLDNILIFTDNLEEHRPIVKRVLEILRKHKLYLRPEKCSFEK